MFHRPSDCGLCARRLRRWASALLCGLEQGGSIRKQRCLCEHKCTQSYFTSEKSEWTAVYRWETPGATRTQSSAGLGKGKERTEQPEARGSARAPTDKHVTVLQTNSRMDASTVRDGIASLIALTCIRKL